MKVVVSIGIVVLVVVTLNKATRQRSSGERRRNGLDSYGYSFPQLESSIETYGDYYEPCTGDDCKTKTSTLPAAYLLSQFLIGSYFLLSALFCALFNTCTSYPTVTFTTSVTVTNTVTSTSTSPTTTTTRTSSTTPTTKTTVHKTKMTTTLPTTFTSVSTTRFRTTTTEFPTTTTTTTGTSSTTTTTTPKSTSISNSVTVVTTTVTNGNGRALDLNDEFWQEILSPGGLQDEIAPSEILGTFDMTQSFKEINSAVFVHEDSWTTEIVSSFSTSSVNFEISTALPTSTDIN